MDIEPGYKQTTVGIIPKEWSTLTLEAVCVTGGLVRGPFGGALTKEVFVKSGKKVYEQKNAIYRDADIGNYFIDEQKFKDLQRFAVTPGEFIVSCAGTIGRVFRIPTTAQAGVINQALLKIRTNSEVIHSDYFYHYFDWDLFQWRIVDSTHGGAMQNLVGMDLFRSVELACPSLPEQRAIAEALCDVDDLLGGQDRLIAKMRDLKQATMRQLLTGQTRLPGFHDEWELSSVGREFEIQLGKMLDAETNVGVPKPFIGNKAVQWDRIDINDLSSVPMTRADIERFRLKKGDLLVCEGGEVGRAAIWDAPINECYYQKALHRLRPLRRFNSKLMAALLRLWSDRGFFSNYVTQTSIAHLPREKFMEIPLAVPPITEQAAIAEVLTDMDIGITALERRRKKTRALKQAMMQELLTGRTRLI